MQYTHFIGIDAGKHTGYALYDSKAKTLVEVKSMLIHRAMQQILHLHQSGVKLYVRVEDARKRKFFGDAGREQLQGAGSVKRDCTIWEDFLSDHNIPYEMVAPKNNRTKLNSARFKQYTNYSATTNEHSRDAAMLVYGY